MGIVINLDVMMAGKKGFRRIVCGSGYYHGKSVHPENNKAKAIRFSTLEAICALDCQPGDILSYEQEEEDENGR